MSDNALVQSVRFEAKAPVREYTFNVPNGAGAARQFTFVVLREDSLLFTRPPNNLTTSQQALNVFAVKKEPLT